MSRPLQRRPAVPVEFIHALAIDQVAADVVLGSSTFNAILPGVVLNALALIIGMLPSTKAAFGQS